MLNSYDSLVSRWKITLMMYPLEAFLVALENKDPAGKNSMSIPNMKAGRICSQKMLIKLCEKICRKHAEMRAVSCMQRMTDAEKSGDTASKWGQNLSPYLFLHSTNMSNTYCLPATAYRARVKSWMTHRPWNFCIVEKTPVWVREEK